MRVLVTAVGTRGDVQSALALALELRQLGQAVRLCISPNFVDWAKDLGLDAVSSRARAIGGQLRSDGANVAARRLEAEYGGA